MSFKMLDDTAKIFQPQSRVTKPVFTINLFGVPDGEFDTLFKSLKDIFPYEFIIKNFENSASVPLTKNSLNLFFGVPEILPENVSSNNLNYILYDAGIPPNEIIELYKQGFDLVIHRHELTQNLLVKGLWELKKLVTDKGYTFTKETLPTFKLSEEKEILDRITDGFIALDKYWKVTYWNTSASRILSMPREKILGKNIWDLYPYARNLKFYSEYHLALKNQEQRNFREYNPVLEIWVDVAVFPSPAGLSIYFRDITKDLEREKELLTVKQVQEAVINSTNDLIWAIDREFNLILANTSYVKSMKYYTGQDYNVGRKVLSNSCEKWKQNNHNKDTWLTAYNKALKGESNEILFTVKDAGQERIFQTYLHPIVSIDPESNLYNEVIGVSCFSRDVTERMDYIQTIEERNTRLRDIGWMQSHILRGPLARIMGINELLQHYDLNHEEKLDCMKKMDLSCKELDQVISEIVHKTEKEFHTFLPENPFNTNWEN